MDSNFYSVTDAQTPPFHLRGDFGMLGFGLRSGHTEASRSNQANHLVDLAHVDAL